MRSLSERLLVLAISLVGAHPGKHQRLQELTGVRAALWHSFIGGAQAATPALIEAITRCLPQHALWLCTGQHAPPVQTRPAFADGDIHRRLALLIDELAPLSPDPSLVAAATGVQASAWARALLAAHKGHCAVPAGLIDTAARAWPSYAVWLLTGYEGGRIREGRFARQLLVPASATRLRAPANRPPGRVRAPLLPDPHSPDRGREDDGGEVAELTLSGDSLLD